MIWLISLAVSGLAFGIGYMVGSNYARIAAMLPGMWVVAGKEFRTTSPPPECLPAASIWLVIGRAQQGLCIWPSSRQPPEVGIGIAKRAYFTKHFRAFAVCPPGLIDRAARIETVADLASWEAAMNDNRTLFPNGFQGITNLMDLTQ